jgi:predicted transposase YdaD
MHEYDTVLKVLLQGSANSILEQITGAKVARWLNVELPEVQQTRVDLLGESADEKRDLIHLELQSTNDLHLPLRMAEYSLRVYRQFQRFPKQVLLYVGDSEMRMPAALSGPDHVCRYTIVDIRTLDSEPLLNSALPADNVIAILTRLRDRTATIRRILSKIGTLETGARDAAFA